MFHIYEFIVDLFLPTLFLTKEDGFALLIHRTVSSAIKFAFGLQQVRFPAQQF